MAILSLNKLDNYYCKTPTSMGIEVFGWFKLFKKVSREDTVVLRIDTEGIDAPQPYATIFIYNPNRQMLVQYLVYFLNIELERFEIPSKVFDAVIHVPSVEFFKVLRWCETGGTNVRLLTTKLQDSVYLVVETAYGDASEVNTAAVKVMINVTNKTPADNRNCVQSHNFYKLEHLMDIARSGSMNIGGSAILYLTKDPYPLVIDYSVGTMGTIKYCLGPIIDECGVVPDLRDSSTVVAVSKTTTTAGSTVLSSAIDDTEATAALATSNGHEDDDITELLGPADDDVVDDMDMPEVAEHDVVDDDAMDCDY